jgi:hypothetical protein
MLGASCPFLLYNFLSCFSTSVSCCGEDCAAWPVAAAEVACTCFIFVAAERELDDGVSLSWAKRPAT